MAKDGKKAALALGGIGLITTILLLSRPAKAAPPPLPPPGLATLYGKVTDAITGASIPDVLVSLNGTQTYTDSKGNYQIENVTPGDYILIFSKEGYQEVIY